MNLERVILGFLAAVLIIVVPVTSPELASNVGDVFEPLLGFVASLLDGIFDSIAQFEGDLFEYLIGAGVSAPLTFGLVAFVKRIPQLKNINTRSISMVIALALYALMIFAQRGGFEVEFNNTIEVAVLVVSLLTGASTAQLASGAIHDKLVDSPLPLAYHKNGVTK